MSLVACAAPLDLAALLDYWLGELAPEAEERAEEHLLGCAACSERLGDLAALAGGVRRLATLGVVRAVVTSAFLERLAAEGLRVQEYRVAPGGSVACTVTPRDDLVAARLTADLRGAGRVDLVQCDAAGREQARLADIPVEGSAEEVVLLERMDHLRALPASVTLMRLVAPGAAGERVLGEYTFVHTPTAG
jgi:hypothetical protein